MAQCLQPAGAGPKDSFGEVVVLVDGMQDVAQSAMAPEALTGYKSVEWDASGVPSGVYFYRMQTTNRSDPIESFVWVKGMLLVK